MKKIVIQLTIHSDKEKQKALKAVSCVQGVDSLSVDMGTKSMTIIGNVDPVEVICRLSRSCCPEILSVGPKEVPKSAEETKKEEEAAAAKKKKEEEDAAAKKKEEEEAAQKKKDEEAAALKKLIDDAILKCDCGCGHQKLACQDYWPQPQKQCYLPMNYVVHSEECPPSCVIM